MVWTQYFGYWNIGSIPIFIIKVSIIHIMIYIIIYFIVILISCCITAYKFGQRDILCSINKELSVYLNKDNNIRDSVKEGVEFAQSIINEIFKL